MKSMESRFVKTHLCGVLVYGVGLYANVWINAYHLYDIKWLHPLCMQLGMYKRGGETAFSSSNPSRQLWLGEQEHLHVLFMYSSAHRGIF
jgi:hypothetical protein